MDSTTISIKERKNDGVIWKNNLSRNLNEATKNGRRKHSAIQMKPPTVIKHFTAVNEKILQQCENLKKSWRTPPANRNTLNVLFRLNYSHGSVITNLVANRT